MNEHVVASKQAPPPCRKNTTLVGSAWRTQNENSLPSAHSQSPPGTIWVHADAPADPGGSRLDGSRLDWGR